ncbi:GNAT family N-acetyltransferase [Longispora albida]|uniref:GNAT family N-acetyltransferase n=1 Tax=Longispora albida TaxID=203523 RepID=UPI00039E54BE|nr:GNAT family N-acetyltransferase [Longispora albida]
MIIRGPSGSGKTSIAREVRLLHGRGAAVVEQDVLRRLILKERDTVGGLAPAFISQTVRFLLGAGWPVIVEGILHADKYGPVLRDLVAANPGPSYVYYLDVPFETTVLRHAERPQSKEFGPADMAQWYRPGDVLGVEGEQVITPPATLAESIGLIASAAGWPPPGGPFDLEPHRRPAPSRARRRHAREAAGTVRIVPMDMALAGPVAELMGTGAPYVTARTASDYWLYARLFSALCPVAVLDGQVVGAAIGLAGPDDPGGVYVQDLLVRPGHRRRGVAGLLLAELERQARLAGARRVWLTSEPANTAAHATWTGFGFTNLPGDRIVEGVSVTSDFKGPGKHRAVYELAVTAA